MLLLPICPGTIIGDTPPPRARDETPETKPADADADCAMDLTQHGMPHTFPHLPMHPPQAVYITHLFLQHSYNS